MVLSLNSLRRIPAVAGLLGLLLAVSGCPLSPSEDGGGGGGDTRLTPRDTVAGTIARLAEIWEQKNFTEYELILHEEFQFFIRDDDARDFPWLPEGSWGRTLELQFAANMFDESFSGDEPPVASIDWDFTILSQRDIDDGAGNIVTEVTCDAVIQVMTGPNDGWRSDTRFLFDIVPDPTFPGLFQIMTQREVQPI